jgi:hypothetical protein
VILWGFEEEEGERFRAMISAIVFGGAQFWTAREGACGTVADFGCGGGRYRLRSTSHGAIFSDLSVRAVGAFGCAVCGGEKEKGSSDAEDAIG